MEGLGARAGRRASTSRIHLQYEGVANALALARASGQRSKLYLCLWFGGGAGSGLRALARRGQLWTMGGGSELRTLRPGAHGAWGIIRAWGDSDRARGGEQEQL